MSVNEPRLDQPFELACGLVLENRIAKAAMTECVADPRDNQPSERHDRLYARWGRGGLGLCITGNVMVDRRYLERTTNVVIDARTDRAALRRWAGAAQATGTPTLVQINHPGRQCSVFVTRRPVAPSPVKVDVLGSFAKPRALEDHEIDALATRYAEVAGDVVDAGFSGVQIHAAHGYLASQFLSPRTNLRDDRWGGSLENRARFLIEAVRRTRARIGAKVALAVKLNSADFQRGGFEEDDALQVARWLEAEGIDLLEVSGGNYESPALMGVFDEGSDSRSSEGERARRPSVADDSTKKREAYFLDFAVRMRREVRTPLMLTGGLRSAEIMRAIVADGSVDVVGLARPLALEPDLPRGILTGKAERSAMTAPRTGWKSVDAMVEAGWYGLQIARMADGKEPDPSLGRWRAITSYLGDESVHAVQRARASR